MHPFKRITELEREKRIMDVLEDWSFIGITLNQLAQEVKCERHYLGRLLPKFIEQGKIYARPILSGTGRQSFLYYRAKWSKKIKVYLDRMKEATNDGTDVV